MNGTDGWIECYVGLNMPEVDGGSGMNGKYGWIGCYLLDWLLSFVDDKRCVMVPFTRTVLYNFSYCMECLGCNRCIPLKLGHPMSPYYEDIADFWTDPYG